MCLKKSTITITVIYNQNQLSTINDKEELELDKSSTTITKK